MLVYVIVLVILLWGFIRYEVIKRYERNILYYSVECICLILLAGFRYKVGGDNFIYMDMWKYLPTFQELFDFDFADAEFQPLWYVFNALCKFISDDYTVFQIIHALVFNIILFRFFWRETSAPYLAVIIFYIFHFVYYNMEILRESLSVAMMLLGYTALKNKQWLKYYIFCLLALGFHLSALFCFIFPFVHLIKRLSAKWVIFIVFSIVFSLSFVDPTHILMSLFHSSEYIFLKIDNYANIYKSGYSDYNIIGWTVWILSTVFVPYILLSFGRVWGKDSLCRGFVFLWAIMMALEKNLIHLSIRANNYLYPMAIAYMSGVFYTCWLESGKYAVRRYIVCFSFLIMSYSWGSYRYFREMSNGRFYDLYIPYTSVITHKEPVYRENLLYMFRDK